MTELTFDKRHFFRTILIFLVLTIGWTFLCVKTDEFTENDKGLLSGLGFLLLFAASIYFGQRPKPFYSFFLLAVITIAVYLVGTFILGPLIGLPTDSIMLYATVNSFFVAVAMTSILNKLYGIRLKYLTIALSFLMLLLAYFLMSVYDKEDILYLRLHIHPRLGMFNIFQLMLIIPLSVGLAINKASEEQVIIKNRP